MPNRPRLQHQRLPQLPPKTLDIGIATPLTGPPAYIGSHLQDGILLAIEDQNRQGGVTIAGQKYTLNPIIRDTKMDIVVGKSVAEEMVLGKGVKVIAGPFIADVVGVQSVTEPNKAILFGFVPIIPQVTGPNKPYTFFTGLLILQMYNNPCAYIKEFYPETKKVVSMVVDMPDLPLFMDSAKTMCARYGLDWLGYEKMPANITDFMPIISRVLAKNPDVIDTASIGSFGGLGALEIKQIREAGFNGIILVPGSPPRATMEEVIPKKYLNRIVLKMLDPESPMVSEAYRGFYDRFQKKFDVIPDDVASLEYNPVKAFFEFLNGQNTMDTTVWMEGFAKYHWQGLFGFENYWVGKPLFGIDRSVLGPSVVCEYTDGKMETKWNAPLPYDLVEGK